MIVLTVCTLGVLCPCSHSPLHDPQVWCGRLAMMGFISSIVVEFQTGKGTLQQIGLEPSMDLFTVMASVVLGATVVGTAVTTYKGFSGKMTSQ